jgi:hypothetical protein
MLGYWFNTIILCVQSVCSIKDGAFGNLFYRAMYEPVCCLLRRVDGRYLVLHMCPEAGMDLRPWDPRDPGGFMEAKGQSQIHKWTGRSGFRSPGWSMGAKDQFQIPKWTERSGFGERVEGGAGKPLPWEGWHTGGFIDAYEDLNAKT